MTRFTPQQDAVLTVAMQKSTRKRIQDEDTQAMIDQLSQDMKREQGFDLDRYVSRPTPGESFSRVLPYIIMGFGFLAVVHVLMFGGLS